MQFILLSFINTAVNQTDFIIFLKKNQVKDALLCPLERQRGKFG